MEYNTYRTVSFLGITVLAPPVKSCRFCLILLFLIVLGIGVSALYTYKIINLPVIMDALFKNGSFYDIWLLWEVALPRALTAVGVGCALGLSGALFQTVNNNALSSPDLIGVIAVINMSVVLWMWLFPDYPVIVGAAIGSIVFLIMLLYLLLVKDLSSRSLILFGLIVNSVSYSVSSFVLTSIKAESANQILIYLCGDLAYKKWFDVQIIFGCLLILIPLALVISRRLKFLVQDKNTALSLGIPFYKTYLEATVCATLLAVVCVLLVGPIGFVALLAPHIARFASSDMALLSSAFCGAALLLLADALSLALPALTSLPTGVITAFLGGLYLLLLVVWQNKYK